MKQQYDKKDWEHDLYRNNAWILDDKFMTYQTILSDKEMSDVIQCITKGEVDEKMMIDLIYV